MWDKVIRPGFGLVSFYGTENQVSVLKPCTWGISDYRFASFISSLEHMKEQMGNPYQEEVRTFKLRIWLLIFPELISCPVINFLNYVFKLTEIVLASMALLSLCVRNILDMFKKGCNFCTMARKGWLIRPRFFWVTFNRWIRLALYKSLLIISLLNRHTQRGSNTSVPDCRTGLGYRLNRFHGYGHVFPSVSYVWSG